MNLNIYDNLMIYNRNIIVVLSYNDEIYNYIYRAFLSNRKSNMDLFHFAQHAVKMNL